ncbi:hypothetical protein PAXINDRAFT_20319 [Paxillus involutus ATCC 200175]|uniref:Unplaced genomic scaffold PAXINscaffold_977, whole genome shotgun sequence n=1 Tax=Paxillus involutus ATCC 200175 TaxID=664439 RepID=A0A0C9TE81_PAXIN|nr:hypothetical protein PAXINDRAFT_20319 [Paxillus involutus ATCC 200175]
MDVIAAPVEGPEAHGWLNPPQSPEFRPCSRGQRSSSRQDLTYSYPTVTLFVLESLGFCHVADYSVGVTGGSAGAPVSPLGECSSPTVTLDNATVTGISSGSVNEFPGILKPSFPAPQALPPYNASLPVEMLDYFANAIYNVVTPSAEDCDKPLALSWCHHGLGAFEFGGTSKYDLSSDH